MSIPITTKVMKHCHSKSYKGKKQEVAKKADGSGGPIFQTTENKDVKVKDLPKIAANKTVEVANKAVDAGKKLVKNIGNIKLSSKERQDCKEKGGKFKKGTCFMGAPPEKKQETDSNAKSIAKKHCTSGAKSIAKKKDKCYYKAKAKYDKFPSAYASGYIAKCRKRGGNIK